MATYSQANQAVSSGIATAELRKYGLARAADVARKYGIDVDRFVTMFDRAINQESGWQANPGTSSAGARGIAQLMPLHWDYVNPDDPYASLDYAANMFAGLINQFGGDFTRGVAAYNYGSGNVSRIAGLGDSAFVQSLPAETQTYINNILGVNMGNTGGGSTPRVFPQEKPKEGEQPTLPEGLDPTTAAILAMLFGGGGGSSVVNVGGGYLYDTSTGEFIKAPTDPLERMTLIQGLSNDLARLGIDKGNLNARLAELGLSRDMFDETQKQNAFQRALDQFQTLQQEQIAADARRQAARETMIQSAPFLTAGREYFGGLEPFGAGAAVANFAGVPFTPASTAQAQVPLNTSAAPAPVDPAAAALIDKLLGGF